ncbi:hypothetical protein ACOACQ_10925 [Nocardioides sp. CPCC 206347]|uniref:hypothetical protein n=2 Tax=Nocardioides TaxID=1839 RepID=UPI003B43487C
MVRPAKALDQVVRNRIAPSLKDLGFTRKGLRFTFERPDGARAVATVRRYTLGRNDAELHVDFFAQPRVWRDFMALEGRDPDWHLWSQRVLVPGATGPMRDHWSFDLDDLEAGASLTEEVVGLAQTAVSFLDPSALLTHVRSNPHLPGLGSRREVVVASLLAATEGPSPELDAMLLAFDQDPDWPDFNPAFTGFLRSWLVTR